MARPPRQENTIEPRAAAPNRREEILQAAVAVFAERGYYAATTAHIAERAGISQPYVFRFFKTKAELFEAGLERSIARIVDSFTRVDAPADQIHAALISAYEALLQTHHHEIVLQMQALVINEESIRRTISDGLLQIRQVAEEHFRRAGLPHPEALASSFMANGMLCNVSAVLGMPELKPRHA